MLSKAIIEYMKRHGPYVVTRTLLAGDPDINRRTIYDLRTDQVVVSYNEDFRRVWSDGDERQMRDTLNNLNNNYLEAHKRADA